MPKRTNDFQTIIKTIYEQIVPEGGSVTESAMVHDAEAGVLREVDLLVEFQYAGHDLKFMIECRDRSRAETVEWIDGLIGKAKSLAVDKVIAVSSKGFASTAKRKAAKNGIETLTFEDARDTDWVRYSFKPGIAVMTDDVYRIHDVLYRDGDDFVPLVPLGLESTVEINGDVACTLKEMVEWFFGNYVVPQFTKYQKERFLEIFKTREDLEKTLLCEFEHDWPGVQVVTAEGKRIDIPRIRYVFFGNRQTMEVMQDHHVFNNTMVSTGKHVDSDGTSTHFSLIQLPGSAEIKGKWTRNAPKPKSKT